MSRPGGALGGSFLRYGHFFFGGELGQLHRERGSEGILSGGENGLEMAGVGGSEDCFWEQDNGSVKSV